MSADGAADLNRTLSWHLIVNEPEAWDDFVRWVWQRCILGDAEDLGLPIPPDIPAALLALANHLGDGRPIGKSVVGKPRCLTCALADMALHCPDCGDPGFAAFGEDHVVVPYDVPTGRPVCEADNFPIVAIGCGGTVTAPLRTIGRDR